MSKVRVIGVGVSESDRPPLQLALFEGLNSQDEKQSRLDRAMDKAIDRFDKDSLRRGAHSRCHMNSFGDERERAGGLGQSEAVSFGSGACRMCEISFRRKGKAPPLYFP